MLTEGLRMRYVDLKHMGKSLDNQIKALSDYKALTDQQIEATNNKIDTYTTSNEYNMLKLNTFVANGVSMNDLNEDLQNSILNAKNAGIDVTELINTDIYLDETKANKSEVYSKNESDRKLSDFYTKNEIDEKVTTLSSDFNNDDTVERLVNSLNAYKEDSKLLINELSNQLNSLKSTLPDVENIASVSELPDIEIETGTEISDLLQERITVTLSNDEIRNISVTWQTNSFNKDIAGIYVLNGILNVPNDISNTKNLSASVKVIVIGDTLGIESVSAIEDKYIEYNASSMQVLAVLPETVNVTLTDGTNTDLTVSWNMTYYSPASISEQTITGKINVTDGIVNQKNLKASVKLKIIYHNIVSVKNIERTYERNYEINYNLPKTVTVILDDESETDLTVSWDVSNVNHESIGNEVITGSFVDLPINISNDNNITVLCNATFVENSKNIELVSKIADINVPLNTDKDVIDIDNEIEVSLNDGTTTVVGINWDFTNYDGSVAGTYYIYGQLQTADAHVTNFNNFTIECAIVVEEDEYVDYSWSHRFIVPAGASQVKNFQEKLGETFTEEEFYGIYDEEADDYDYSKRKVEMYYLGSTLQDPDEDTIVLDNSILNSKIVKTSIIDMYGSDGLLIPLGSESNAVKNLFDSKVEAADESSIRSIDFYAGDLLVFENKTSSNQIFLIRRTKHSYVE